MKEVYQAWVTAVLTDTDSIKALVMARSLRRVFTTRRLVVLISKDVSPSLKELLEDVFDLALTPHMPVDEIRGIPLEVYIQAECWNLTVFKKCIFINPNHLVIKNIDHLFDAEDYTKAITTGIMTQKRLPCTFFAFHPSTIMHKKIVEFSCGKKASEENLDEHFNMINGPDLETRLHEGYMTVIKSDTSYSIADISNVKIAFFKQLESMDEFSTVFHELWTTILFEDIRIHMSLEILVESGLLSHHSKAEESVSAKLLPSFDIDENLLDSVAIIGLSCKLPGANNPEEFWKVLYEGKDCVKEVPVERWDTSRETKKTMAGFIDTPIDEFDAKFFNISPREAIVMDPQQRLLLESTWEALENAYINPQDLKGSTTGVFMGFWNQDYQTILKLGQGSNDFIRSYLGNAISASSARLSFFLGSHGPNMAMESGCSSSLLALHHACESLKRKDCNLALAGGVNLILVPYSPHIAAAAHVLAPDGHCKTFDEKADGFGRGEGVGVIVLKRFSDAVRDNDNILAIVRGSAFNQEGTTSSFGTPSKFCQQKVMEMALKKGNVVPDDVTYIEAHGTGTFVGDPIEISAIGSVYGKDRKDTLLIGSVKTNIGHSESAAGIAGLIKMVLSFQKQIIPANINFSTLNPYINLGEIPAKIPLEPTEWIGNKNGKRVGALNSFGMSGTNVHVILEEPPKIKNLNPLKLPNSCNQAPKYNILNLSAKSEGALNEMVDIYKKYLKDNPEISLNNICYTANCVRTKFNHRVSLVAQDCTNMESYLERKQFNIGKTPTVLPKVAFLFTGQGSQYKGMCKKLYDTSATFKVAIDKCADILKNNYNETLFDILWNDEVFLLDNTVFSQTAIFCIEYSLIQVWKSFGIAPDIVFGHSVGEFAAAVAAEVLSMEDALKLVYERSRSIEGLPRGGMMAVKTSLETVNALIDSLVSTNVDLWLDVAVVNSIEEIVVAGRPEALDRLMVICDDQTPPIRYQRLAATHGFHSRDMEAMLSTYGKIASTVKNNPPKCGYISGSSGELLQSSDFSTNYWQKHLRDPVNFQHGVEKLYEEGARVFIEVGPQPILLALGMTNLNNEKSRECSWLPTIRKSEDELMTILSSISNLFVNGIDINLNQFYLNFPASKVRLPNYPFQRQKYWVPDSDIFNLNILHPLIGKRLTLVACSDYYYEHKISLDFLPYLNDHKVVDRYIFPGAGFLEMILASGHLATSGYSHFVKPSHTLVVHNFSIEAALELEPDQPCQIQVVVKKEKKMNNEEAILTAFEVAANKSPEMEISICKKEVDSDPDLMWRRHAKATFTAHSSLLPTESFDIENIRKRCTVESSTADIYKRSDELGVQLAGGFQSIKTFWRSGDDGEVIAEINCQEEKDQYICHPLILDALIQVSGFSKVRKATTIVLPVGLKEFIMYPCNKHHKSMYAYVRDTQADLVDVLLLNEDGEQLASMLGVQLVFTSMQVFTEVLNYHKRETTGLYEEVYRHKLGSQMSRADLKDIRTIHKLPDKLSESLLASRKCYEDNLKYKANMYEILVSTILHAFLNLGYSLKLNNIIELREFVTAHNIVINQERYVSVLLDILTDEKILESETTDVGKKWKVIKLPKYNLRNIEQIFDKAISNYEFGSRVDTQLAIQVGKRLTDILGGNCSPLTALFPNEGEGRSVADFYTTADYTMAMNKQSSEVLSWLFSHLATKTPAQVLRILEVGAGTAATTKELISVLTEKKIPFMYTFTDISPQFLSDAEVAFADVPNMEYKLLNIEKEPKTQNFAPYHYDIIFTVNVIHATERINESITHLRYLLSPGGILVVGEMFKPIRHIDFIFGTLEGYWRLKDFDLRPEHPMISGDKWQEVLKENGFVETNCIDTWGGFAGLIVGRASDEFISLPMSPCTSKEANNVWILFSDETIIARYAHEHLKKMGKVTVIVNRSAHYHCSENELNFGVDGTNSEHFKTMFEKLNQESNFIEGIIFLWALNEDRQENVSGAFLHICQFLTTKSTKTTLCAATKGIKVIGDQIVSSVEGSTLRGILASLLFEQANVLGFLFDMDHEPTDDEQTVREMFYEIWTNTNEFQMSYRNGKKIVSRLNRHAPLPLPLVIPKSEQFILQVPQSKSIQDLVLIPKVKCESLSESQVEVEIRATGLNFRDVFVILKPEGFYFEYESVGMEFSGTVSRIGKCVNKYSVGDEVFGLTQQTALASHVVANEFSLMRKPCNVTFPQAATLPVTFITAYHCLIEVAKIKTGETVLIHVASGGVGLAAIQICKYMGVEIIGTAGSKRKRKYIQGLGVEHVFHSRNTTFGDDIMRVTNGIGVDMVLNSLTGTNMKETSLRVCKPNARFVEMSKIQIWQPEEVKQLRPDVAYTIVNLETGLEKDDTMLPKVEKYILNGIFKPLPYTQFDVTQSIEAFLHFQKALQIGKIVVTMPKINYVNSILEIKERIFNEDSTYLITGGLGGIGMEVTKWMSNVGAKHIILIGRKEIAPETRKIIDNLNSKKGANISVFQVDVGDMNQLVNLLETINKKDSGFPPLRGIIHSAGTLSDGVMTSQTWEKYLTVFNAKVRGTWNLHNLTKSDNLEFFILFSSAAAVIGDPFGSNHAAANCFMDAFAHYRNSIGLPAQSINWGIWGEVGAAANLGLGKEGIWGIKPFSPKLGIGTLRAVMRHHLTQVAAIDIQDASTFVQSFKHLFTYVQELTARFGIENLTLSSAESDKFWRDIRNTEHEKRFEVVQKLLEKAMRQTLKLTAEEPIDEHQNFKDMGMDSLMAVEMRNRLQHIFGKHLTLNATSLMDHPTLSGLSNHLAELTFPIIFEEDDMVDSEKGTLDHAGVDKNSKLESEALLLRELVREDCVLPDEIKDVGGVVAVSDLKTIFITGSTGTMGVYIVNLLSKTSGMHLICLIRAKSDKQSKSRLIEKLRKYNLYETTQMTNIECLNGDITRPCFGLDIEKYNSLAQSVDAVFHLAVKANHYENYKKSANSNDLRSVNVLGSINVLKFATTVKTKRICYTSTFIAATELTEDEFLVEEFPAEDNFGEAITGGYATSKFVCEKLFGSAVDRGIPCVVLRLPDLSGNSITGLFAIEKSHLMTLIIVSIQLGVMPSEGGIYFSLPVDIAASATLEIFLNHKVNSGLFNLVKPEGMTSSDAFHLAGEYNYKIRSVPLNEFADVLKTSNIPILAPFLEFYESEKSIWKYFRSSPALNLISKSSTKKSIYRSCDKVKEFFPNFENVVPHPKEVFRRHIEFSKTVGMVESLGFKLA